jgi:hypothetical protein
MVAGTPERYPAATANVNILDAEELLAALDELLQLAEWGKKNASRHD